MKLIKRLAGQWPEYLGVAGVCFVTHGVKLIYAPAGYIVLGFACMGAAYLFARDDK